MKNDYTFSIKFVHQNESHCTQFQAQLMMLVSRKRKNKFPFILALNLSVRCSEFFFSHFHLCNRFANFSKLQIQNAAFLPSNALTPIDILNAKTKKTMMMKKRNLYAVVDLMVSLLLFSVYFIFFLFCVHIQTLIA